jgi:uncharacterized membrane protein YgcG
VEAAEGAEVPEVDSEMARRPFRFWRVRAAAAAAAISFGLLVLASPAMAAPSAAPAGPPYPSAVSGQHVYDNAGIFSSGAISAAEATIGRIEDRTGAQIAVYTQVKPQSGTLELANSDAAALMDQWGVGRKGFDDGLVIMFDMQPNLAHGQVSLYAGSGFRAAFLTDSQRQSIFDDEMVPMLRNGEFDLALTNALNEIDAAATPEHAAALERDRQINALVAAGGLLIGLLLAALAFLAWLRHGRDATYLDDASVLLPAPPAELTPAMATLLIHDRTSDATVTAGLVDLAARGCIAFQMEPNTDGGTEAGIAYLGPSPDKLSGPEDGLHDAVKAATGGHDARIKPEKMYRLRGPFTEFKDKLETSAVKRGWLAARPTDVMFTWQMIGGLEITAAIVAGIIWIAAQASGLLVLTLGLTFAGSVTVALSWFMPARTRQGAMLYAMLSAYRRTMKMSMAQAQSMGEVVKARALPWVQTPDQAMAWAIALGLNDEVQDVLTRSAGPALEQDADGQPLQPWRPSWWMYATSQSSGHGAATGAVAGAAGGGMFSATALPDPGALLASLGSIAHASSPATGGSGSSSGSSFSSGGFGGGGSSGGGGAGGGF